MVLRKLDQVGSGEGGALGVCENTIKRSFDGNVGVQLGQGGGHAGSGVDVIILVVSVSCGEVGFDFWCDGAWEGAFYEIKRVMAVHFVADRG